MLVSLSLLASCNLRGTSADTISATPEPSRSLNDLQRESESAEPCDLAEEWSVEMTLSGGLAGVHQVLRVDSRGEAQFIDRGSGAEISGSLSSSNLATLSDALASACAELSTSPRREPCPDCLQYEFSLEHDSGRIRWLGSSGAGLEPSIQDLLSILQVIAASLQNSPGD